MELPWGGSLLYHNEYFKVLNARFCHVHAAAEKQPLIIEAIKNLLNEVEAERQHNMGRGIEAITEQWKSQFQSKIPLPFSGSVDILAISCHSASALFSHPIRLSISASYSLSSKFKD